MIIASALLFVFGSQKQGPHLKNYRQYNYVLKMKEPFDESVLQMQTYAANNEKEKFNLKVITPLIKNFETFKYIPPVDNSVMSNFSISSFNDAINTYNSWSVEDQEKYVEITKLFSKDLPANKASFPTHYDDLTNLAAMLTKIDMSIIASETEYNEGGALSLAGTIVIVATLFGLVAIWVYRIGTSHKRLKLPTVQNSIVS